MCSLIKHRHMTPEKRKFNKRVKANKRRASYLKRRAAGASRTIDFSKFVQSMEIPVAKKKQSFFGKLKDKFSR